MPQVHKTITVSAPAGLVYSVWRNLSNLSLFMDNIHDVRALDERTSHWKATGPLGTEAEWDAEMTVDKPEREIGWQSLDNNLVQTSGHVQFEPRGDDTLIDVTLEYETPAGAVGDLVAKIFADPERQVEEDLARFKQAIEHEHELSRFKYAQDSTSETLGASMGASSPEDLSEISQRTSSISPEEVDDPATRERD